MDYIENYLALYHDDICLNFLIILTLAIANKCNVSLTQLEMCWKMSDVKRCLRYKV
jgi:hypothetical protein